jgi:hypothetical protein
MTRVLELPESVYAALQKVAESQGLTPAAWIAANLSVAVNQETADDTGNEKTMADRFAGRLGRIRGNHNQNGGDQFADYLEQKR